MARKKRLWHPEHFYHVVMRGNHRQNIFNEEDDINAFLSILLKIYERYPFIIVAYCFMSNHYHLLLQSPSVHLSKIMMLANKRYSDYFQRKHETSGQLYEKRYYSSTVSTGIGLLEVSRYIHQNPVNTKLPLVKELEHYPYSSYLYYKLNKPSPYPFLDTDILIQSFPFDSQRTLEFFCAYTEKNIELSMAQDWGRK